MEQAGGIAALGIDWKILVAQLVNFLIIYFLLSKFAFKPLSKMLEARKKRVDESVATAQKIEKEKEDLDVKVKQTLEKARDDAQDIINKTQANMKEEQSKMRAHTEAQTAKMLADTKQQIASEKKQIKSDLVKEIGMLVIKASERIIREDIPENNKKKIDEKIIKEIK